MNLLLDTHKRPFRQASPGPSQNLAEQSPLGTD